MFSGIVEECATLVALVKELPRPRSNPATGRIAIGSMKLRPTLCNTPKILSFIVFLLFFVQVSMHSVGSFEDAIRDDDFHIIINTKKRH